MTRNDREVPFTYGGDEMSIRKVREYVVSRLVALFLGRSVAEIREENIRLARQAAQYKRASEEAYRDGTARILQCQSVITSLEKAIDVLGERDKDQKAEIGRLATLVDYDALSGLLNRPGVIRHLAHMASALWRDARYDGQPVHEKSLACSVAYIDLDNFKPVNDTWGHHKGDEVLRNVAELLRKTFSRENDLIARVGGDEFVVVMTHSDVDGAAKQADHLRENMRKDPRFLIKGADGAIRVSASIGLALMTLHPESGGLSSDMVALTLNRAIGHADKAMYDAKQSGKDSVSVYRD